ncbi:MAG: energy-coupling factor transporter ATPase [Nitrososphaeria archaeon]
MSVVVNNLSIQYLKYGKPVGEPALKNLCLKIEKGEKFGILGPTGSGKTTLSLALNGFFPEEIPAKIDGEIVINGIKVGSVKIGQLKQHIGYVFYNPDYSLVELLVEDDIAFGPSNLNLDIKEIQARVSYAIQVCRLKGYEKRKTYDLSGGETQQVAIAGLIAMRTPIMVLDEPVTMLDPLGKNQVFDTLNFLNKEYGITIILTEAGNDIEYFLRFVDKIAVLYKGQLLKVGSTKEILADKNLLEYVQIDPPPLTKFFRKWAPVSFEEAVPLAENLIKSNKLLLKKEGESKMMYNTNIRKNTEHPIIMVKNLHHIYPGNIHALKGINLEIHEGEKVAIIGQNGSGKTTLALHLVGLLKPSNPDAKVIVGGLDVSSKKVKLSEIIKIINYSFQNPDAQLSQDTVYEEIAFGLKLLGLNKEEVDNKVKMALNMFDLYELKDTPIFNLSLSAKRRLTVASLIALGAKILILDEPTNGLSSNEAIAMMEKIRKLNLEGNLTYILISHNMEVVAKYADRLILMADGRILVDGPVREVFYTPEILKKANVRPPQVARLCQQLNILLDQKPLTYEELKSHIYS